MNKTYYVAVYGHNQIPFPSLEKMREYFDEGENLFDAIMADLKCYKVIVEPVKLNENA